MNDEQQEQFRERFKKSYTKNYFLQHPSFCLRNMG